MKLTWKHAVGAVAVGGVVYLGIRWLRKPSIADETMTERIANMAPMYSANPESPRQLATQIDAINLASLDRGARFDVTPEGDVVRLTPSPGSHAPSGPAPRADASVIPTPGGFMP